MVTLATLYNDFKTLIKQNFYDKDETDDLLDEKQATLISGTNIKTVNNNSLLGSGNISISGSGTVDTALDTTSTNPVQNQAIATAIDDLETDITSLSGSITNKIYPVGSIYMSVNSVNPSTLFGGTWEKIKDTFLLASGDVYSNGATGGEATHTLTVDEMPSHTHKTNMRHFQGSASTNYYSSSWTSQKAIEMGIDNTGGGQPHNNMPPYLAVNVWKRTA